MRNKTQLPFENFAVLHDGSKEFSQYLEWAISQYEVRLSGACIGHNYGVHNGIFDFFCVDTFYERHNVPIISAKEFMDIVNLPIDWVIERNEENYKEVNEWANGQGMGKNHTGDGYYIHSDAVNCNDYPYSSKHPQQGFTLITTEQFRLWRKWFDKEVKEEVTTKVSISVGDPNQFVFTDNQLIELLSNRGYRIYKDVTETIEVTNKTT